VKYLKTYEFFDFFKKRRTAIDYVGIPNIKEELPLIKDLLQSDLDDILKVDISNAFEFYEFRYNPEVSGLPIGHRRYFEPKIENGFATGNWIRSSKNKENNPIGICMILKPEFLGNWSKAISLIKMPSEVPNEIFSLINKERFKDHNIGVCFVKEEIELKRNGICTRILFYPL
jgi:hypothetical protein